MKIKILFLVFVCLVAWPHLVRAQDSPRDLVAAGQYQDARQALIQIVAGRADKALHLAYLEGLIAAHAGDRPQAIETFRTILRAAPQFLPARRELVVLLAAEGRNRSAVYHAEHLAAATTDRGLRERLQAYIRAENKRKPNGYALRFSIAPTTNVNNGTEAQEVIIGGIPFEVDPDSRAKAGARISAGVTGWAGRQLGPKLRGIATLSLDHAITTPGGASDATLRGQAELIAPLRNGRARLSFGLYLEAKFSAGDLARRRTGVVLNYQQTAGKTGQFGASLDLHRQSFPLASYRDGRRLKGKLSYRKVVSASRAFTIALPFEVEQTGRAHLDHRKLGVRLGWEQQWRGGLATDVELSLDADRFRGNYPGFAFPRQDDVIGIEISARHSKWALGAFAPEISYSYTRASSSIDFFDYESHGVGVSLSSRF